MEETDSPFAWPPPYTLRESSRAKSMRLSIEVRRGLELVVPKGTSRRAAERFLNTQRDWVYRHAEWVLQAQSHLAQKTMRPDRLILPSLDQVWTIVYEPLAGAQRTKLLCLNRQLALCGQVEDVGSCVALLNTWLKSHAQRHLTPQFSRLSQALDLPYAQLTWRAAKTRWGSCGANGAIMLNTNLLFLPENLVRAVMVHELCHTRHLNHSADFWALVGTFDPDYRLHRKALRSAHADVPAWCEG